jgi:chemotaxis protein MotB
MALARARRRDGRTDFWPGFVDAMATLLLVIIFLLSVFMLAQFFLSQEITGRDTALSRLNLQVAELTELLAMERAGRRSVEDQLAMLRESLAAAEDEQTRLQGIIDAESGIAEGAGTEISRLESELDDQQRVSRRALAQVELLNQQISALRRQIAALESALEASESRDRESQARIADLGRRLNVALAQRVQELSRYRSDFFGRLREILSQRADVRVVGDRFVFQSEVLFATASDEINEAGHGELEVLAGAILELQEQIPEEIDWIIRVDGHTDARPIRGPRFQSNWELSTARAIAVVRFLMDQGVSPNRLVAAGFAENRPLQEGDTEEAHQMNRRIEFKLTER